MRDDAKAGPNQPAELSADTESGAPKCAQCSRRAFVIAGAVTLAGCAKSPAKKSQIVVAPTTGRAITQTADGTPIPPASGHNTDAGLMSQYAADGVYSDFADDDIGFFVIRREGVVYALSSICTHKGCTVKWSKEQDVFNCHCHHSEFAIDGQVLPAPPNKPPTPANKPLPRYAVREQDGRLLVDCERPLPLQA